MQIQQITETRLEALWLSITKKHSNQLECDSGCKKKIQIQEMYTSEIRSPLYSIYTLVYENMYR